jgi:preprotein translocase subunit YajC
LLGLGGLLVLCIVLGAGILLGRFSVPRQQRVATLLRSPLSIVSGHGAIGTLQSVSGQTLAIELRNGTTQTVLIDKNTRIERNREKITLSDLKQGDWVTVIGSPNDQSQIVAKWVRVLSPAETEPAGKRRTPTPSEFK